MAQQYTANFKICATCEYWSGFRTFTSIFQNRIEVESPMDKGKCMKRGGPFFSSSGRQANAGCRCYELWGPMKK